MLAEPVNDYSPSLEDLKFETQVSSTSFCFSCAFLSYSKVVQPLVI